MGFILLQNGKQLGHENIKWKFNDKEGVFESRPEKLERNIAFWRNKLGATAEVVYLNVKEETYDEPTIIEPAIEPIDQPNDSVIAEESSLPHDAEAVVDRPKRKPRKKTT
jgi:hypothetical protein